MGKDYDCLCTIVLVGYTDVGKTSIFRKFVYNSFSIITPSTARLDWKIRTIDLNGLKIKLKIWDTPSYILYRSVLREECGKFQGLIFVFDINDVRSFHSLFSFGNALKRLASGLNSVFIVGNKSDLEASRQVSYEEVKRFADGNGINYIEVSALTGHNVEALFRLIAMEIVSKSTKVIKRFK